MRLALALTLLACPALAAPVFAAPAEPQAAAEVARLEVGVFCALQAMDRMPAPGTASGWIHVPTTEITFHWPDRQVVPAALGLAFGVRATGAPGFATTDRAEVRVTRPGGLAPEVWSSGISDAGAALSFFRFDTADELVPGLWTFEAWDGEALLYRVEFEVVPAAAVPEIVDACGATS
ncbi:DUF3859 domain-containing protein [Rhodobacter sp. SGA-6-6]|uniref:DUF3859 domain-containing protein n=1 Tax=Rhodobacter sp. SGA-6-6 TaxID=2710882 RepID=UPI0013EA2D93|nr:DUF3859 domain-containing protein [Rhodobacter sp. SGA-6-6]NGM45674.1 DUF3859 domain-containing protein [Rhodobacter sp. SGA-6-6]